MDNNNQMNNNNGFDNSNQNQQNQNYGVNQQPNMGYGAVPQQPQMNQFNQPVAPKKKGLSPVAIVFIVLGVIALVGIIGVVIIVLLLGSVVNKVVKTAEEYTTQSTYDYDDDDDDDDDYDWYTTTTTTTKAATKKYGFNETFTFKGFEVTIGDDYSFTTVNNSYSQYNGQTVVKIPITVKNSSGETGHINMFSYSCLGSQGTKVNDVSALFSSNNDSLAYAGGDLRDGASYSKYLYYIYDGDGTYTITFSSYPDEVIAEFEIKK